MLDIVESPQNTNEKEFGFLRHGRRPYLGFDVFADTAAVTPM